MANPIDPQALGRESISKLIRRLALPAILAQVINLLYNIVDRIFIARIPEVGAIALSGVGIVMPIILIISAFSCISSYGGAPLASMKLGAGRDAEAEAYVRANAGLMLLIGTLLTAAILFFMDPLLILFAARPTNISYARDYLSIYAIGNIFVLLTLALNSFISAQGAAKVAMRTILIGAICNIVLDPIFIFTFQLGVRGAALATILSQFISFISVLAFLSSTRSRLRLRGLSLNPRLIAKSIALGASGFTMMATESAVVLVYNQLLAKQGGDMHVATMVVLQSVMQILFIPMAGYMAGVQPLLSYNFGAQKMERVREIMRKAMIFYCSYSVSLVLLVLLFPGLFASIFTNDPELHALVVRYLPIFLAGAMIFGFQDTAQMFFVGTGRALQSIFLASLRKIILLIPFAFILSSYFPVIGVYAAESCADFLSASCAGILFTRAYRRLPKVTLIDEVHGCVSK
ncbi:MAG: MATE family efflux transporter [Eubacteriales bacterium]|nr:MATE family efflux transporter [Eubacteriales bacterium]